MLNVNDDRARCNSSSMTRADSSPTNISRLDILLMLVVTLTDKATMGFFSVLDERAH